MKNKKLPPQKKISNRYTKPISETNIVQNEDNVINPPPISRVDNPVIVDNLYTDGSEYAITNPDGSGSPFAGIYHEHANGEKEPGMGSIHNINPYVTQDSLLLPIESFSTLIGQTPPVYGLFINEIPPLFVLIGGGMIIFSIIFPF